MSHEPDDWKTIFGKFGVEWAKGSSVNYVSAVGKINIVNSKRNIALFEEVLEIFNVQPYQIEIGVQFVEFDKKDIVRHDLVQKIVTAYERHADKRAPEGARRPAGPTARKRRRASASPYRERPREG